MNSKMLRSIFISVLAVAVALPAPQTRAAPPAAPLAEIGGSWSWPSVTSLGGLINIMFVDTWGFVYVSGSFADGGDGAGGNDDDCDYICLWDGSNWSWPSGQGLNGPVEAMIEDSPGGPIYAVGQFDNLAADGDCDYICLWDGSSWSWPTGQGLNSSGYSILETSPSSSMFIACGDFTDAGGDTEADFIGLWNEATDSWSWPTGQELSGLCIDLGMDSAGNVYAGGSFTNVSNDTDCDYVCLWNGSAFSWPSGASFTSQVNDIVSDGNNVYVTGGFLTGGGDADCNGICLWDGSTWSWPSSMGLAGVRDIELVGANRLLVSGDFIDAGGDGDADRFAYWNGSGWEWPSGAGITTSAVNDLALYGARLYAGGNFLDLGGDTDCDYTCVFSLATLFADGVESGDFTAWTSFNNGSGNMTVCGAAAMEGSNGVCLISVNNKRKQLIDGVPADETVYAGSFQMDTNGITISGATDRIRVFSGRNDATFPFILLLRYNGGAYQVRLRVQRDDATYADTPWIGFVDAPHTFGVVWHASGGPGANNGYGELWVDGTLQTTVYGVDNDTLRVDGTRLGITSRMDGITFTGTLYIDDFYSNVWGFPEP